MPRTKSMQIDAETFPQYHSGKNAQSHQDKTHSAWSIDQAAEFGLRPQSPKAEAEPSSYLPTTK